MANENISLGILQAAIALAGLLLIFVGFLLGKADQIDLKSKRTVVRILAVVGLIPFSAALVCAWQSVWSLQGAHGSAMTLFITLKIVLALTFCYAIMATFFEVK